ncbi:DNA-directed RNA polymerase subunit B [archaeon CG10_big_fil_rev_8_21_14_0_10_43_11]|nr:MAG: DNA-directed RNA polymerase subunit B [archaeon CG10_big_fil_rev_8_21_14_0_10_43_11]
MADVSFDHIFVGTHDEPVQFIEEVKKLRRAGIFPSSMNVYYNEVENSVEILTEKGRARRPLLVVEKGVSKLTKDIIKDMTSGKMSWHDLVKSGIIEYLDSDEEENALIAITEKEITKEHTHVEISPNVILGVLTAMVPFSEYNQGPRVSFGARLQKQSIGLYTQNFHLRQDTDSHLLFYPQRPIVDTLIFNRLRYDKHPCGSNIVIAVMSFDGYNVGDSIIFNKSSIERGLFRSAYFKPYKSQELRYLGGQVDLFEVPDKDVRGYKVETDYRYLEEDGLIHPEAIVSEGDVVIGKTSPPRFLAEMEEFKMGVEARRDASIIVHPGEDGVIDSVVLTESEDGNKSVKVKVRKLMIPEIGDKFSTRHGQKGVIGMVYSQEDMPFTASGVVPDIIFNPHSLPGRMTLSQVLETLAGKVGALTGEYMDGTAFEGQKQEEFMKKLKELGFREDGSETLYDGVTGEQMQAKILVGNIYYMRLKHLVSKKIHARSRGPMQLLTRQPTEGRVKDGGLRLGEMEKDVLVAHGASLLLKERFDSDKTVIPVCENCGLTAVYNTFRNEAVCPSCKEARITFVEMSYAFKLMLDELRTLGIHPKLNLKPKKG